MKRSILLLILALPMLLFSAFSIDPSGILSINDIQFKIEPYVRIKTGVSTNQTLQFTASQTGQNGEYWISFANPNLDLTVHIEPSDQFLKKCYQATVTAEYKYPMDILNIALQLEFLDPDQLARLRGPKAINSGNNIFDTNLYPYTDRNIEFRSQAGSFWIAGSNYSGCKGIEWIDNNSIRFYDNSLHYARLYVPPSPYYKQIDFMPRSLGQSDTWSFLMFEEKPVLLSINRWPGEKKAAFAFSNDADLETVKRLEAIYFGSSDPLSERYLKKGLIAHNIKISNTVFGNNYPALCGIWDAIYAQGNTIGYHTYSDTADSTHHIGNSLLNDLANYNIRLWVDHSLPHNPEDFGMQGGLTGSPYYILDIINQSDIDYVWLGETPFTNSINAFDDPWRLPHKLYYFQNLTKPVWFFGRTRMETWEYLNDYYPVDLVHNLTAENLDNLLTNRGLCIAYTHFSFTDNSMRLGFFQIIDNDEYIIREDFDDKLKMLNLYQQERGLWIDTVENILDRMLAIEQVEIVSLEETAIPGFHRLTIGNNSDVDLENLSFTYGDYSITVPLFSAQTKYSVLLNSNENNTGTVIKAPFKVLYTNGDIFVSSKQNHVIPALDVAIYNVKGQLVAQHKSLTPSNYLTVSFTGKSSGVYIAKIKSSDLKTQIQPFLVVK